MHRLGLIPLGLALALLSTAPTSAGEAGADSKDPLGWPAPTRTARPWSRWWWLGSAVDAPNIERLLAQYKRKIQIARYPKSHETDCLGSQMEIEKQDSN